MQYIFSEGVPKSGRSPAAASDLEVYGDRFEPNKAGSILDFTCRSRLDTPTRSHFLAPPRPHDTIRPRLLGAGGMREAEASCTSGMRGRPLPDEKLLKLRLKDLKLTLQGTWLETAWRSP